MREDQQKEYIFIPSYSNAFKFHIFGRSAGILIFDSISLFLLTMIIVYGIGQLPYLYEIYQWTWHHGWWFIQYLAFPALITTLIVFKKKDGLSFWRWVYVRIIFSITSTKYTPFTEPITFWKRFWNWIRREEEIY